MHIGPFQFTPGETREVELAFAAAVSSGRPPSVTLPEPLARRVRSKYPAHLIDLAELTPVQKKRGIAGQFGFRAKLFNFLQWCVMHRIFGAFRSPGAPGNLRHVGKEIAVLMDRSRLVGLHQVIWNGHTRQGIDAPAGVEFYHLESGNLSSARRFVSVRQGVHNFLLQEGHRLPRCCRCESCPNLIGIPVPMYVYLV